jgi:hypothetical protein
MREDMRDRPHACHFYRNTFHQHFPGENGLFMFKNDTQINSLMNASAGQACIADASYDVRRPLLDDADMGDIPTLDFSALTHGAGLMHMSTVWARTSKLIFPAKIDCSHYCYSPWLFDPMWSMIGTAINDRCGIMGPR